MIVSMRYLIITPPSQNAKSARRARKVESRKNERNTTSIMIVTRGINDTKKSTYPALRNNHHLRHQIARKNGQLPHKPAARVRRQRVSSATVVEPKLMFVLNLDKVNVIAPQLAKSVSPIRKIKLRKTNSQNFLVAPRQLGSTKVAR